MNADQRRLKPKILNLLICVHLCSSAAIFAQDAKLEPADKLPTVDELLKVPTQDRRKPDRRPIDRPVEEPLSTEPFELAVADMREAAQRLGTQEDAGIETQRVQEQVVKRLDMLLSQMRRQQQRQRQQSRQQDSGSKPKSQQQQQSQEKSSNPAADSDPNAVNRQQTDAQQSLDEPLEEDMEEWGKLPPRLRQALQNVSQEKFSALYRDLTQRYYRRLAEESE